MPTHQEVIETLAAQVQDAQAVANWLFALLCRVHRQGYRLAPDGSDLPRRVWLTWEEEPETCP